MLTTASALASGRDQQARAPRDQDEQRVAGRMRLMLGDIEVPHAEREVDRIEILERRRQVREMEREKDDGEENGRTAPGNPPTGRLCAMGGAACPVPGDVHVGRRNSPSLRLPVR